MSNTVESIRLTLPGQAAERQLLESSSAYREGNGSSSCGPADPRELRVPGATRALATLANLGCVVSADVRVTLTLTEAQLDGCY
jgi:hypothetical protein